MTGQVLLHFFPTETEQLLTQAALAYRNVELRNIRRTYFSVRKDGNGFKFVVTSQSYLR